jgi:hypothetical protein
MASSGGKSALDDTVRTMRNDIVFVLGALLVSACTTSSHTLLGVAREALPAGDVRVFLEPVSVQYDKIAIVDASSRHSLAVTAEAKAEVVMERLKSEAAKLGANGIVLEEIADAVPGSIGVGAAPDLTRDHASIGVGFNAARLLASRYGRAVAIYIAPAVADRKGR